MNVDQAREARDKLRQRVNGRVQGENGLTSLTPREVQVLRLIATGADNPSIGEDLEIKRTTVARHVANILEKLGATNRAEAASLARMFANLSMISRSAPVILRFVSLLFMV